jgi:hypothetical protein
MKRAIVIILALAMSLAGFVGFAAAADDGSTPYPGYTGDPFTTNPMDLITQEYFGNEWVNTIPSGVRNHRGQLIMSPYEHHGYISGSPLQLTPYDGPKGTYSYYKQLGERSPRAKFFNIGKTHLGLDMYVLIVSSEDTIAHLDQYKQNLQKLYDPRKLGYPADEEKADKAAEKLITDRKKTKPMFWVWGRLHSGEVGSGEMDMELAYRLCVDERPMFDFIRENTIVMFSDPNPDGTEMMSNWVDFYLKSKTGIEPGAPYYNWYIQHDNNRDGIVNSVPEGTNLTRAYLDWPAQAVLDIHQSFFLLFTFSGMEPTFPSIDPIMQTEWQWLASRELNQTEQFDMPAVFEYRYVNFYYPFYGVMNAAFRNGMGRFYEVYGPAYPNTHTFTGPFRGAFGEDVGKWYWYNPMPYYLPKIVWSLRNNNNYSQTCALTTAEGFAKNPTLLMENFWKKAKKSISMPGYKIAGSTGLVTLPYGYVVPAVQKDMPETIKMINKLLENGVEVGVANNGFAVGGASYPMGSFVIKMNQPNSRLLYALFDPQTWPKDSPPPYDSTAWQWNLLREVTTDRIDDPAILNLATSLITVEGKDKGHRYGHHYGHHYGCKDGRSDGSEYPQIKLDGVVSNKIAEGAYVVDHNSINNIVTLFFGLAKQSYSIYMADAKSGVIDPGDLVIPADQSGVYEALKSLVSDLGLTMNSVDKGTANGVAKHKLTAPRVAVYHEWSGIQEGGWSRLAFDTYQVPHDMIQRTDVLAGNLRAKYDVIFLPNSSGSSIYNGVATSPNNPEVIWYGPVQTLQRTGGLKAAGIAELKKFVDEGGLLICNNNSCDLPITYNLITGVTILKSGTGSSGDPTYFFASGPVVRIKPNLTNPIAYGGDEYLSIYDAQSPVFPSTGSAEVVASFPMNPDEIFQSGWLDGATSLAGKPCIVRAPAKDGTGHVLLFGTNITYRMQALGSYFLLWNAIMNWNG